MIGILVDPDPERAAEGFEPLVPWLIKLSTGFGIMPLVWGENVEIINKKPRRNTACKWDGDTYYKARVDDGRVGYIRSDYIKIQE